ncbi:MAG: endonuclease MutS2 [Fimbriimonadaceae bacterium]|nr:endonuclease MutS2 [Fimbriimonadaceae bacterium]QYK55806.1 MAG: endonuclease MutS2 [Fimbriimonadaceae bacterium]
MHALRVIEFDVVRQLLAEACDTVPGRDAALEIEPHFDPDAVAFELERTEEADALLATDPVDLRGVRDVAGQVRVAEKGAVLDGEVLYRVGESLRAMRSAGRHIERKAESMPRLSLLAMRLPSHERLEQRLLNSLDGDGTVRDEASISLGELRARKAGAAQRILERVQSYVSGPTRTLLSDPLYTVRDGRYVIPLKAENRGKIRGIVHDTSASGHTIYVEPEDVVALGNALREAEAAERAEIARILAELSEKVGAVGAEIRDGLEAAAELDLVLAKVRFGREAGGCLPTRAQGAFVRVKNARHPLIPRELAVPLSMDLGTNPGGPSVDVLLITGPNTGGKTVAIKTVGLAVAMAQAGMMPLADSVTVGCFSQIWADIGDEQSLQQSLSTFSGHIKNISEALAGLKRDALVLLDEVGAGTDPGEGANLARALLLAFQKAGAKVMASTHYGELKILASNAPGFLNASMEFDLKSLRPTYRLLVGVPGSSHAMKIAERYGVPRSVIEEAVGGVSKDQQDVARMIEKLEQTQKQASRAQGEADRLSARLREVEREAEAKVAAAEEARTKVRERAVEELEALLREIRLEASDIFEELKKDPSQKGMDRARDRMKQLQDVGRQFVEESKPKPRPASDRKKVQITRGSTVRIRGFSQTGIVLEEPSGNQVSVQVGPLRMTAKVADLTPVEPPPTKRSTPTRSLGLQKAMTAGTEIHLRQMRAEDAIEELERFLDDAVLGGVPSVRIVHGKGEGVLRNVTRDVLRKHKDVRSFRTAEPGEGGEGVTIALFK